MTDSNPRLTLPPRVVPHGHDERRQFFRELAHVVHLGRCTRWPYGGCTRHEEDEYFTPKDNDIASSVLYWLVLIEEDVDILGDSRFGATPVGEQ